MAGLLLAGGSLGPLDGCTHQDPVKTVPFGHSEDQGAIVAKVKPWANDTLKICLRQKNNCEGLTHETGKTRVTLHDVERVRSWKYVVSLTAEQPRSDRTFVPDDATVEDLNVAAEQAGKVVARIDVQYGNNLYGIPTAFDTYDAHPNVSNTDSTKLDNTLGLAQRILDAAMAQAPLAPAQ